MVSRAVQDEAARRLQDAGYDVHRVGAWLRWSGPNGLEIDMRHPTDVDVDTVVAAMTEIIGTVYKTTSPA